MAKHKIIQIQEDYIRTGEEQYLTSLYENLLRIGRHCLKKKHFYQHTGKNIDNIVFDVAQSVVMRLMDSDEPIIKRYPYKYMERAILYSSMPDTYVEWQLGDNEAVCQSTEEEFFNINAEDDLMYEIEITIRNCLAEESEEVFDYIFDNVICCLKLNKPYERYIYKIRKMYRKLFIYVMEQIREMLEERV